MPLRTWWEFINDFWKWIKWRDSRPDDWSEINRRAEELLKRHNDLPVFREFVAAALQQWSLEEMAREEMKKRREGKT